MKHYLLYHNEHYRIEQSISFLLPGYLFVVPHHPIHSLAELSMDALASLGPTLAVAIQAVEQVLQPYNVYCAKFGETGTPLHFHILPRTAWLTEEYHKHFPHLTTISGPILLDWVNRDFVRKHPTILPPDGLETTVSADLHQFFAQYRAQHDGAKEPDGLHTI